MYGFLLFFDFIDRRFVLFDRIFVFEIAFLGKCNYNVTMNFMDGGISVKDMNLYNFQNYDCFVQKVSAHYHFWAQNSSWKTSEEGRLNNALMFFINCKSTYYVDGVPVAVGMPGDIAFVPKGAKYSVSFEELNASHNITIAKVSLENFYSNGIDPINLSSDTITYNAIFVGFDLLDSDYNITTLTDKITIIRASNPEKFLARFKTIVSCHQKGITTPLSLNSALYRLLNDLTDELQMQTKNEHQDPVLQPAIQFILNNDLSNITVAKLSEVCNISPSGFRSLFKKNMGISPIDYISDLKIQKAQALLADKSISIADIAHNLGFNDVAYFSRFFKKRTGYSPSDSR